MPRPQLFKTTRSCRTTGELPSNSTESIHLQAELWNHILNHAPAHTLRNMANNPASVVPSQVANQLPSKFTCSACYKTNTPRSPHKPVTHDYQIAEALPSDVCGPMQEQGMGGERYFVTFLDVNNRFAAAIPIISRAEVPSLIEATFANFRREFGKTPKLFVSDNATNMYRKLYANRYTSTTAMSSNPPHTHLRKTVLQKGLTER